MKKSSRLISIILSLSILLTLLLSVSSPIVAYAEGETVLIDSPEDFKSFSENCSYDLWSKGKSFILTKDISLEGLDIQSVPVFSGSFDGGGHTISGFDLSDAASPAGLFAILEVDGIIKNLTVSGVVAPEGDRNILGGIVGDNYGTIENCEFLGTVIGSSDIGGIVGINRVSGSVTDCLVAGEIIGEARVGGIAGSNEGLISSSVSGARVNTISITPSLTLDEINISLTLDITKLPSLSMASISDVGGIAGYSTGIIMGCANSGRVGYPHIGYNVGGIVGRSNGHINGCINNAEVFGRKDVGGIAGHMEPHIDYDLSEDLLYALKVELDELSLLAGDAINKTDGSIPTISGRLDSIITNLDGATDSLDSLIGDIADYGGDMTGEINRMGAILQETLSQISSVTEELPYLAGLISDGLSDIESALDELDDVTALGVKALSDIIELIKDASLASDSIKSSLENLEGGLDALKNAITIKDQAKVEAALGDICDRLFDIAESTDGLVEKLGGVLDVLEDCGWVNDAISEIERLSGAASKTSGALKEIYDATIEIKDNIEIYWSEIETAGDEIVVAIDCFASSMSKMIESLDLMDAGLEKMTNGMDALLSSVDVKDPEAVKAAAMQIVDGLEDMVNAAARSGEALASLAESLKQLEENGQLSDIFDVLADSMGDLPQTGGELVNAMIKLSGGMKVIFDNIEIDFDLIEEGGTLVIGGVRDMTEALRAIRESISKMNEGLTAFDNAVTALSRAVVIDDRDKVQAALDNMSLAIGEVVSAMEEISDIFENAVEIMKEAKLWSDGLIDSLSGVLDALDEITSAVVGLKDGVDLLRENIDFDLVSANAGLEYIIASISDMAEGTGHIKNAMLHLSDALVDIKGAGEELSDVTTHLANGIYDIAKAMDLFGEMSKDINSLVKYLMGVDPIQLPTLPESATAAADQLFIYISAIERELKYLNSDITQLSSDLVEKIGRINEIFNEMSDNVVDMIYGLNDGSIFDDKVAESEVDSITDGKLFACQNNGRVEGDINVGGISGVMGVEYSLDPEDDFSIELSVTQKKQYMLKAVIHSSVNNGEVVAKYDCAGGITGKMDFGLIYECESYGDVESLSGNYVGGISGIAAGRISESYAKCTLAGNKYVGGIVGSGVKEDYSGDSSMVVGCYSMVEIKRASQYFGAVSGVKAGEFEENLFVSDKLSGIDRVSYHKMAERVSYEELMRMRSIPTRFYSLILKFVADGVVLDTVEFEYGESLDSAVFPEIPKKDGHYGVWDKTDLTGLTFDTTVSVIYTPYTTTISSDEKRENGREIILVQGNFTADAKLSLETLENVSGLVLEDKFFTGDSLVEGWILTIPEDENATNGVHLLPPTDHCRIFIKIDDVWTQVEAEEFGSYLTFDVSDERVEIAIVQHTLKIVPIIIIGGGALLLLAAAVVIIIVKKKKISKKETE